jgi:hypothetical protein
MVYQAEGAAGSMQYVKRFKLIAPVLLHVLAAVLIPAYFVLALLAELRLAVLSMLASLGEFPDAVQGKIGDLLARGRYR